MKSIPMTTNPLKIRGMINGAIVGAIFSICFIVIQAILPLKVLLMLFLPLLLGTIGYLRPELVGAIKVDKNRTEKNQPQRIQFSLARLLLATAMVALVFGTLRCCFNYKESMEIVAASMIAIALGGLVLVTKKIDYIGIIFMIALFVVIATACGIIIWTGVRLANW
jgi:hypothetical protein